MTYALIGFVVVFVALFIENERDIRRARKDKL